MTDRTHLANYDHLLVRRLSLESDHNPAAAVIFDVEFKRLGSPAVTAQEWRAVLRELRDSELTFGEYRSANGIQNRRL